MWTPGVLMFVSPPPLSTSLYNYAIWKCLGNNYGQVVRDLRRGQTTMLITHKPFHIIGFLNYLSCSLFTWFVRPQVSAKGHKTFVCQPYFVRNSSDTRGAGDSFVMLGSYFMWYPLSKYLNQQLILNLGDSESILNSISGRDSDMIQFDHLFYF